MVLSCVIMIMLLSCVIMIMGGIVMCDNDNDVCDNEHGWYCHV